MPMKPILIAGIGTDVGKTIVSAILVRLFDAFYFKPVSSGYPKDSTSIFDFAQPDKSKILSECYHFKTPASPHQAAAIENQDIDPTTILLPRLNSPLIIESAGGVLVPINRSQTTLDIFKKWDCEWIVVSKNYLGSINHTLLTLEILRRAQVNTLGIIFNGNENSFSESFILENSNLPMLGRVHQEEIINRDTIERYVNLWKQSPFWKSKIQDQKKKVTSGIPLHKH